MGDFVMKLAVLLLAVAYGAPFGEDRARPEAEEAAIADNGRSQSVDGPGADGPGRYKKNGELRQPRTQEEKEAKSAERKRLKAMEKEQAKIDAKQAKKDAKQAEKDAAKAERKQQRLLATPE